MFHGNQGFQMNQDSTSIDRIALCEKVAILVDGGFYQYRAHELFGEKKGAERADELVEYCMRHLKGTTGSENNLLYRIFYYDCPPIETNLWHPYLQKQIAMKGTEHYAWSKEFLCRLANKRKVAIRLGELQEKETAFRMKDKSVRQLFSGSKRFEDLSEDDFELDIAQKGVDMRIGLDIASLAYKRQVSQIILISGDSDFIPAAKHARREGIDFVLDPMWQGIREGLNEHIDGLHSCTPKHPTPQNESLCIKKPKE